MIQRLPSLNALRSFEVVADQLSVKKAAQILNVSESAVSRQVKILEEQLDAELFVRSHAGLRITEAGQRLAIASREAFAHISNAVNPFRHEREVVTIKVLPTFALRWLLPRIRSFQERNPLIQVKVQTRLHDMILNDSDADLGIRYGTGNWPTDYATELYSEWILPVCSPSYLGDRFSEESAFSRVTLLHSLPDQQDWRIWSEKTNTKLGACSGLDFDALDMALSAAESGLGVAVSDVVLADPAIQSGRLIVAFRKIIATGQSYYLVRAPNMRRRREVKLFDEWLCDEIEDARKLLRSYIAL